MSRTKKYDYEFSLPWPPTLNKYRACVNNRLITSKLGRIYHDKVCFKIKQLKLNHEAINKPILIYLTLHPLRYGRYDCSNFLKAYEDALVASGFLKDDQWIEYGLIKKGDKIEGGLLDLKIQII